MPHTARVTGLLGSHLLLLPPALHSLQLLKKKHLSDVLEVAELRDGVVAFEDAADADRFAGKLEEEGHSQVGGEGGYAGILARATVQPLPV
jgi:hypothetical protein